MNHTESRLVRCFSAVFPALPEQAIAQASQESVAEWDSVATITLVQVLEEEFGIAMEFEDLENLVSFGQILAYLSSRQAA